MEQIHQNINKAKGLLFKDYGNILNEQEVEDLVYNTYLYFVEKEYILRFDASKSNLFTYFMNLLKMETLSYIKYNKWNVNIETVYEDIEVDKELDINNIDKTFTIEKLNKIIPKLNKTSNVNGTNYSKWYLYIIDNMNGLSMQEIAEKEGVSPETIKSRIYVTRRRIIEVYCKEYGIKQFEYNKYGRTSSDISKYGKEYRTKNKEKLKENQKKYKRKIK